MAFPEFADFYREVHGVAPHRWQIDLAARVITEGWPTALDVPTGLGKTSVLDIAVYAFAHDRLTHPRRMFLVVDRRLVVDQAHTHAHQLAAALQIPSGPATTMVAERLRAATAATQPVQNPLVVARLRGGVSWATRWVSRPDQPVIVTGTVDQIGSRMLFRGYGTSTYARPIDAALTFADSLILLDEAHLSAPFQQTIIRISALEHRRALPVRPARFVSMSATTSGHDTTVFRLDPDTHRTGHAAQVLSAGKRLFPVRSTDKPYAQAAATLAIHAATQPGRAVVVFANTVATARTVFGLVANKLGDADTLLLTGRSRPADREALLQAWLPRITAGRSRTDARSLVVVATQTLEVGADVDFDMLITEPASLDALIHRLGRLNRRGTLPDPAPAIVLAGKGFDDSTPVYGTTASATWDHLLQHHDATAFDPTHLAAGTGSGLDVSPLALRSLVEAAPPSTRSTATPAPLLLDTHLDLWARTSPTPDPDLPVAPFLHGLQSPPAEVSVVWRAATSIDAVDAATEQAEIADTLALLPPSAEEMLELPLAAVRSWLASAKTDIPVADTDTTSALVSDPEQRWALRYLPDRDSDTTGNPWRYVPLDELDLRAGDIIVVPSRYGGCDRNGWSPRTTTAVPDLSLLRHSATRRPGTTVHLSAGLLASLATPTDHGTWVKQVNALFERFTDTLDQPGQAATLLTSFAHDHDTLLWPAIRDNLASAATVLANPRAHLGYRIDDHGTVIAVTASLDATVDDNADDEATDSSSLTGSVVALDAHQQAVADCAVGYARALGLPEPLQRAVYDAGRLHDLGKHDERFQLQLHRGDPIRAALAEQPLAKSGMDPSDHAAWHRARTLSGYPRGLRHEALSAALATHYLNTTDADPDHTDLVIHLVAAHHGRTRPLMDPHTDPDPRQVTVTLDGHQVTASTGEVIDWTSPARFTRLHHRYGHYGLALLETIVRLADMTCSAEGS
ncbi:type I-U CRISPR-associated helicase/endonuclease Cas3 [Nocardia sp. CDC159]|uniref:Type I-U CRISPR-associated helicase/endonuclease Cas3 n=1 Tax=Nocardia pulmonis TaxID=2951408 RepID=A0A9X2E6F6_9NOCA|nr:MULTISPECIES: type I-U CRISPR-associated helicase/endonuclease Cas3 [Nocardia]MCM6774516.1 type I-U CRISPR-associated helicase/endonuclease Cas3 [Nocardia pulmonis]MCM6787418.1 type I-U CRISPR-associated helicase/endonuclease Cas3 [Nocardia sp. CDC159]